MDRLLGIAIPFDIFTSNTFEILIYIANTLPFNNILHDIYVLTQTIANTSRVTSI